MFRRPTEISSDASFNEAENSNDHDGVAGTAESNARIVTPSTVATSSEALNDTSSVNEEETVPDARYHSNMMLATLLEELARTRAVELLNTGSNNGRFTRSSPEVQHVASRMFGQASRVFAENQILPATFCGNDLSSTRRRYLAGLDSIGVQALKDVTLDSRRAASALLPQEGMQASLKVGNSRIKDVPLHFLKPVLPSPIAAAHLVTGLPMNRYRTDFQEIKMLGRGGFGQVWHTLNYIDNQHYAIKRIPLNQKMVRLLLTKDHDGMENALREIRTLARLEHCNIVRYYNAWLEAPQIGPDVFNRSSAPLQKLLATGAQDEARPRMPLITSTPQRLEVNGLPEPEIVFAASSGRSQVENSQSILTFPDEQKSDLTESVDDTDIFTGGSRPDNQLRHPDSSSDCILHIQMSVHPMTLSTYLSPVPITTTNQTLPSSRRHCFHLIPSLRILLGILSGLQYLHALGICHRDIKPSNILLSERTGLSIQEPGFCDVGDCELCPDSAAYFLNPRIADFGLVAEMVCKDSLALASTSTTRTAGTELYKPSQAQRLGAARENVDGSLDVFALGVVLFEMLWPINTRMERQTVLSDLHRGKLPEGFAQKFDSDYSGVGCQISSCILGMLDQNAGSEWTCAKVKNVAETLLALKRK